MGWNCCEIRSKNLTSSHSHVIVYTGVKLVYESFFAYSKFEALRKKTYLAMLFDAGAIFICKKVRLLWEAYGSIRESDTLNVHHFSTSGHSV